MNLTPREKEKLLVSLAAMVARARLERGVKLNHPEAIALITDFVVEGARDGRSVAELMEAGAHVVGAGQCMDGIAEMIHDVQVEATFPGRHQAGHRASPDPLRRGGTGMVVAAAGAEGAAKRTTRKLRWPFVWLPDLWPQGRSTLEASGAEDPAGPCALVLPGGLCERVGGQKQEAAMIPGEVMTAEGEITLNAGAPVTVLRVSNTGDRPVQVGSHYHFAETNRALDFDRAAAMGQRLDIPAGTAVRFEPGQTREVRLVPYQGLRRVYGFNQAVMGALR